MFINKIGMEHVESGTNCQDYGFSERTEHGLIGLVCDGCSEGKHSEVGAKIYSHLMKTHCDTAYVFDRMIELIGNEPKTLRNYLSFTILKLYEHEGCWLVDSCGDGYVILQDHNGEISFLELSDGEYPKYYVYNYIDKDNLKHYKDGVSFTQRICDERDYNKVGIASDGLRFILQADEELKQEFIDCLKSGKEIKTKLFINRNHKIFRDDVTIVF